MEPNLDPLILTTLQNAFLEKISLAFSVVSGYAVNIFYYMAIIELTLFGIIWAMRQEPLIGQLLLKIVKLSTIIFVITQYPLIAQTLLDSFSTIAFQAAQPEIIEYINNPGKLWEFGFDASMSLLRISVHYGTFNVGLSNLYLILGLGILFLFALIGTQILLTIVSFYWTGLIGLFLTPFGAFTPLKNMFENTQKQLIIQAARVATIIFVVGIGVSLWQKFDLGEFTQTDALSKPLGLFISALVVFILSSKLPIIVSDVVGDITSRLLPTEAPSVSISAADSPNVSVSTASSFQAVASATQMDANLYSPSNSGGLSVPAANVSLKQEGASGASVLSSSNPLTAQKSGLTDQQATQIARSISKETVHKIQQSLRNKHE